MSSETTAAARTAAALERPRVRGRNGNGWLRPGGGSNTGPRRSTTLVRRALVEALRDPRGGSGKEFFIGLKTGTAEDRRTFASVCSRLIPLEVTGDMSSLVVNVVKLSANGEQHVVRTALPPAPSHGTCVIEGRAENAPIDAPSEGKTDEESAT